MGGACRLALLGETTDGLVFLGMIG